MKIFKCCYTVEWCHCDMAGIVFYPHFYTWFDQATEKMFKTMGFPYTSLTERFNVVGAPLLETGSNYKNACKLGDDLNMESWVAEFDEKTFLVKHKILHADGSLALEGFERRIMVTRDPSKEKGMKATAIPDLIKEQFRAD